MSKNRQPSQGGSGSVIFMGVIVASLILVIGVVVSFSKSSSAPEIIASSNVSAVAASNSHDWGEISMKDGNVEAAFKVKNEGSEILKLYDATTSCTCTTAQLVLGENKSPLFGMHAKFDYVLEVPPGETAQIKTVFDPAFHGPTGVGPITRQVTVKTNDALQSQLLFNVSADVTR